MGVLSGYLSREYRPGDASTLTDLFNEIEKAAGGRPGATADYVDAYVSSRIREPAWDSRLVFDPDGALIAYAIVGTPPPGGDTVDISGGVHPAHRGRAIGRDLLSWQLERAGALYGAAAPEGTRWVAEAHSMVDDESAHRLLARHGLLPVRYFFDMTAPTRKPADPAPLPRGLRVETYSPHLERDVYEAHVEAFSDHWGYQRRPLEQWMSLTVRAETFRPDLSRIAFDGDRIAGYLLSYDDAEPDRVYIGAVGTRRPWRRRGLAGSLLAEVLGAAGEAGKACAALGVDADSPTGAVSVYERAGFTTECRAVAYRREV
jgi:mycothiol synthase